MTIWYNGYIARLKGGVGMGEDRNGWEREKLHSLFPRAYCGKCWWLSDMFTSKCVNEDSPKYGETVRHEDECEYFDEDEEKVKGDEGKA